jgi:hypothetical protein
MNKPTKEKLAAWQAAKDLLQADGILSRDAGHRIQNKNGNGRGQWGRRFKAVEKGGE